MVKIANGSFLALMLVLAVCLPAYASTPSRSFGACAGPPLPPSLPHMLAQIPFYKSNPLGDLLSQSHPQDKDAIAQYRQGLQEQLRFYALAGDVLSGSLDSVMDVFLNPQPGDSEHFRSARLYYFAFLHGLELSEGLDGAFMSAKEHVTQLEAKNKPTNYTWYSSVAGVIYELNGSTLDVESLYGPYINMDSFRKEVMWVEILASLKKANRLYAAKRYDQALESLEKLGRRIELLVEQSPGCAESPSIVIGQIVQNFVATGSQLVMDLRQSDSFDQDSLVVYRMLGSARELMMTALEPVDYPGLSARILRASATYDRLRAQAMGLLSPADRHGAAAERSDALADFLEGQL